MAISPPEGASPLPSASRSMFLLKIVLGVIAMLLLGTSAGALDSAPVCSDALGWGTWAKVRLSQKTINMDDVVTLNFDIVGGPPNGFYCGYSQWQIQGTTSVTLNNPNASCFDIIDYSPKADSWHTVSVGTSSVTWGIIVQNPLPPSTINDNCFCRYWGGGQWADLSGCPPDGIKHGAYSPGASFSLTLKAKCAISDTAWRGCQDLASLSGNWGVGHSASASDYYKFGGSTAVSLTADPTSLPADGSVSRLLAHVFESESGVDMPSNQVNFSMLFGVLNPPSAVTNSTGYAVAELASPGVEGNDIVLASTPDGDSDQVQVSFTPATVPPIGPESELGRTIAMALVSDPVNPAIGNYVHSKYLFGFPGVGLPIGFEALYNSMAADRDGPLGYGWTHTFNVVLQASEPDVTIFWGDGRLDRFRNDGEGAYPAYQSKTEVVLTKPDSDTWVATLPNRVAYQFNAAGQLTSIADLNGNQIAFSHSSHLDQVTDTVGRQITFTYDGGRIQSIQTPLTAGATASFSYDPSGNLTGITDARGKTCGFTYDGSHRVLTQTDAKGVTVLTNVYDGEGRVSQQTDGSSNSTSFVYSSDAEGTNVVVTPPSGHAVEYEYDLALNLNRITDGSGNEVSFAVDSVGRIQRATDKNGNFTQVGYDSSGNAVQTRDRDGGLSSLTYNDMNRLTSVTDVMSRTTSLSYDDNGNITAVINPLGYKAGMVVDASGKPTTVKDFRNRPWTLSYNAAGLPQTVTNPLNAQTTYAYNEAGRPTQVSEPLGVSVQMTYDEAGNLSSLTDPLGHATNYVYDDNGNLVSQTFVPNSASASYSYDWAGRPVKFTDALGGEQSFEYDADGNLVRATDPDGVVTDYAYDESNRLISIVNALGHGVAYGYNAKGDLSSVTTAAGETWTFTYNPDGQLVTSTDPDSGGVSKTFDNAGRLTQMTDERGETTNYEYDKMDNLVKVIQPGQITTTYEYDSGRRLARALDPLGQAWAFTYNDVGMLTKRVAPDGKTDQYAYDALNRVTVWTMADGSTIAYGYDLNGRMTNATLPGPSIISFEYDAAGNLTSVADSSGVITMTYDLLGQMLSRTDVNGKTMAFTYTPAGRIETITYPGDKVVEYEYDAYGRLATVTDWLSNVTTIVYDLADRISRIDLPNGTSTEYEYDDLDRVETRVVKKSDNSVLVSHAYAYDAGGKIVSIASSQPQEPGSLDQNATYAYDAGNRLPSSSIDGAETTYAYDASGNLTSKTSGLKITNYAYDALNRLVSVDDGTNTTAYAYDGLGNRLSKTYNGDATRYVRNGGQVYMTLNGTGDAAGYNMFVGSLLLYSLDASGNILVYHTDESGSVVAMTDAGQNVLNAYAYGPYGELLASSGSLENPFQFVGAHGVMADENGLMYMQARYYDPELRRFITQDPIGTMGGLNVYAYAGGDPVGSIDPSGLQHSADELITAIKTWLDEGVELGLRDPGYLFPNVGSSVTINGVKVPCKAIVDYVDMNYTDKGVVDLVDRDFEKVYGPPKVLKPVARFAPRIKPVPPPGASQGAVPPPNTSQGAVPPPVAGAGGQGGNWLKRLAGSVAARIGLGKLIAHTTVRYVASTSVGEAAATYGVGSGVGLPIAGALVGGLYVGGKIGEANLVYDPITGKYISVNQGLIESMTPGFEKSYRTSDPTLKAALGVREFCKRSGIDFSSNLNMKP